MTTETKPETFAGFPMTTAAEVGKSAGYCIMLYGKAGVGKTTLAAAADDSELDKPVLFIDAEGGVKAISDRTDVKVIEVKTWDEIKKITNAFKTEPNIPFRTIVLDNLSEFIQLAVNKIVGNAEAQVQLQQWGTMAREVVSLVRDYRDLARLRGINCVIIAWDSPERDETGKLTTHINATPRLQKDLPGVVDIVGYLSSIDNQPDKRVLSFEPSSRTIAKFRRNTSDTARTIPNTIVYGLDNLPLADIFAALSRDVPFPVAEYAAAKPAAQQGR